jgi:glutathione-independent formaldehyde dehydrogenase
LIIAGRAKPSRILWHELPLCEAPGDEKLDKRLDGYTKVVLHPAA